MKTITTPVDAAGQDYDALPSNFRIRWRRDQVNPRYIPTPTNNDPVFQVNIIDDSISEPIEYFEIELIVNPDSQTRNGFFFPSAVGRVTIIDNEQMIG